jgi:hypothetical protein
MTDAMMKIRNESLSATKVCDVLEFRYKVANTK